MKNSTITFALGIALFTSMTLLNCSKKDDPAPAPATTTSGTTTSGTTTSGTTTSGTTTSGTTTSGTTTAGTTTSGTTTAGTTAGTTTAGTTTSGTTTAGTTTAGTTTSGTTTPGTGTLTVNGVSYSASKMIYKDEKSGNTGMIKTNFTSSNGDALLIFFIYDNSKPVNNYPIIEAYKVGLGKAFVVFEEINPKTGYASTWETVGTINLINKKVTFKDIVINEIRNGKKSVTLSGDYQFE